MIGKLLVRGLLAGAIAALLAFAVARIVGEPSLDLAIAFEEAGESHAHAPAGMPHDHAAAGHSHGAEVAEGGISRTIQAGVGLLTGLVVYGAAMGGLFSLAFAFAYGRVGPIGVRGTALLLAGLAFVAIVVVPFLKYPANPPGASQGETIGYRTQWYMILMAFSVGATVLALWLQRLMSVRLGNWGAGVAAAAAYAVVGMLALRAMPSIVEVPDAFPADVLWDFRIAALGTQAVLWAAIGLVFGLMAERVMTGESATGRSVSRPA